MLINNLQQHIQKYSRQSIQKEKKQKIKSFSSSKIPSRTHKTQGYRLYKHQPNNFIMLETYTKPSNVSNSYTHLYSNPNINSFNVEGSKIRIQDTYADRKNANGNSFRNIDQTNIYRMLNNKTNLNGGYRGIFGSERKIKWSKDQCNNNIKFKDERDCNTDNKSIYANNKQNTDEQPHISRFNSNLGVNEDYGYDMDSNYKNVGNRRSDKRRRQRITLDNYIQQQQWCKTQNMKSMRNPHFISQQEYYNQTENGQIQPYQQLYEVQSEQLRNRNQNNRLGSVSHKDPNTNRYTINHDNQVQLGTYQLQPKQPSKGELNKLHNKPNKPNSRNSYMNVAEDKGVNINADNSNKQTNMKQSTQQTSVMHINTVSSNTYQGDALNQNPMFQETGGFVLNIGKNKQAISNDNAKSGANTKSDPNVTKNNKNYNVLILKQTPPQTPKKCSPSFNQKTSTHKSKQSSSHRQYYSKYEKQLVDSLKFNQVFFCAYCFRYIFAIQKKYHYPNCQNQVNLQSMNQQQKYRQGLQKLKLLVELSQYTKYKQMQIKHMYDCIARDAKIPQNFMPIQLNQQKMGQSGLKQKYDRNLDMCVTINKIGYINARLYYKLAQIQSAANIIISTLILPYLNSKNNAVFCEAISMSGKKRLNKLFQDS